MGDGIGCGRFTIAAEMLEMRSADDATLLFLVDVSMGLGNSEVGEWFRLLATRVHRAFLT